MDARDLAVSAAAIWKRLRFFQQTVILLGSDICAATENFLCQLDIIIIIIIKNVKIRVTLS